LLVSPTANLYYFAIKFPCTLVLKPGILNARYRRF
jgi:hypothetical protein